MSSIVRTGGSNIDRSADLRGLSTDTKPTRANGNNVPHGSTWYNMDDCTKYMYNENDDTWYNIPNGGGGGGTGDMQKSVYDPTNTVANAGGIDTYVETEINGAKSEIITEVEGNIATIANNLIDDTVGWTNKNLLPITLDQLKAINTSGTWEDNVYTYRNITITVDIFNNLITGINVNGVNTAGSVVFKLTDNFVYQFLSEDKYYISDDVDTTAIVSGSAYISVERKKGESGESHYLSTNNEERSTKFTVDYSIYDYYFVNIYIPNNSSINNAVFYPMIRRASISDDTYEPYTKTVKDEIFNLNSSVGNLKSRVGIVEGNITTLNEIKANKSDLGTASTKNSTSIITQSTDLVESGAVYDALQSKMSYADNGVLGAKNFLENLLVDRSTGTINVTHNSDDSITVSAGTAGSSTATTINGSCALKKGIYRISGEYGSDSIYVRIQNGAEDRTGRGTEFTLNSDTVVDVRLFILANTVLSAPVTIKPMICLATDTDRAFKTYAQTNRELTVNKADNSVIAPVEDGATVQKSGGYAVGSHAIRNGAFITWKNAKAQNETINDASDYTSGDVADELNPSESSITTSETMSDGYNSLYKWGKMVQANLRFKTVTGGTDDLLGTIPSGYRPLKSMYIMAKASTSGDIWLEVNSNGNISLKGSVSSENIQLHTVWMTA